MRSRISVALYVVASFLWIVQPAISHEGEKEKGSEEKKEDKPEAAQETHGHKAPHGGIVITVGKYHYEMVVEPKAVSVYLLDDKEQTLSISEVTGNAIIQIPGEKPQTVKLTASRDHLNANVDLESIEKFVALVSLKIDGKTRIGRFSYQKPVGHQEEGHEEGEAHDH